MKQKHADLIKAWADGAQIQRCQIYCRYEYNSDINTIKEEWIDDPCPSWAWNIEYRFKPRPDITEEITLFSNKAIRIYDDKIPGMKEWLNNSAHFSIFGNFKVTYDGATHELKDIEIIK